MDFPMLSQARSGASTPIGNESILATGFWWMYEGKQTPVDIRQYQADCIDNQLDVLGKAFLGQTIACARCHDHKFDAIATRDQLVAREPHTPFRQLAGKGRHMRDDGFFAAPSRGRPNGFRLQRRSRKAGETVEDRELIAGRARHAIAADPRRARRGASGGRRRRAGRARAG